MDDLQKTIESLIGYVNGRKYNTIYANPPWKFQNSTGKVAPGYRQHKRYDTMSVEEIKAIPVADLAGEKAHLYLWVPNALLPDGLSVMDVWGFEYKSNLVWEKVRRDGEPDGRGVGFYFRNVTELLLFGIRKDSEPNRTMAPARSQVNLIRSMKREYSRKPDEMIPLIEACSREPRIGLFAGGVREGWDIWDISASSGEGSAGQCETQTSDLAVTSAGGKSLYFGEMNPMPSVPAEEWEQLELPISRTQPADPDDPGAEDAEWEQMELNLVFSNTTSAADAADS